MGGLGWGPVRGTHPQAPGVHHGLCVPLPPLPKAGDRPLNSPSLCPDDPHPKGGVIPLVGCHTRRQRGATRARAQLPPGRQKHADPAWRLSGQAWGRVSCGITRAVTMENLPSPPRQLPACLPARQRNRSPGCRPPCQTASLSHTQQAPQTWPQGGTAGARLAKATSCSSGVGKGRGREEGSSGAQAEGAGSGPRGPWGSSP